MRAQREGHPQNSFQLSSLTRRAPDALGRVGSLAEGGAFVTLLGEGTTIPGLGADSGEDGAGDSIDSPFGSLNIATLRAMASVCSSIDLAAAAASSTNAALCWVI